MELDKPFFEAIQFLAFVGQDWPREFHTHILTYTASVHTAARQLAGNPPDLEVATALCDRMKAWTADNVLRFVGTIRLYVQCVKVRGATLEDWTSSLQNTAEVFRLSDEEVAEWRDLTVKHVGNRELLPSRLMNRLATGMAELLGTGNYVSMAEDLFWGEFVREVMCEYERRMADPEWTKIVDSMIAGQ